MLAKPNDLGDYPVAMSHSVGASMNHQAKGARPRDSYEALYPVDQSSEIEEDALMILWGDVSIGARHPNRIML